MNFGLYVGTILAGLRRAPPRRVILRIEEALLCEAQSCSGSVVLGGYVFYISINNQYYFYELRPSKTGRGEGGLLCVEN